MSSSNSTTNTTSNEDDKEDVEIVSVDVMDVSQKIQEIRSDVPFIKDVMKAHRLALNECQYKKLEKLVEILGNNGSVSMTVVNKIEVVIGKLKSRFSSLLAPIETIDISNDSAAKSKAPATTKNGNSPDSSTSAKGSSVASSSSQPLPNVQQQPATTTIDGVESMQPSSSSEKSATTAKDASQPKTSFSAQAPEAPKDIIRTQNPHPFVLPLKSKPLEATVEDLVLPLKSKPLEATVEDLLTSELPTKPTKQPNEKLSHQSTSTTDAVNNKSGASNDRRTRSRSPSNSMRRFNQTDSKNSPHGASVNDKQRNKTSVEGAKPSQASTRTPNGVAATSATSCGFVRRTIVPSDYLRKTNSSTPHDSVQDNQFSAIVKDTLLTSSKTSVEASSSRQRLSIPNELTSNNSTGFDFVRRAKPAGDFTRRSNPCNPVPPQTNTIVPDYVRRSYAGPGKEANPGNSLEEARKKLAALRGEVPLASNSNDPRGRKPNYTSSLAAATQLPQTDISIAVWPRIADIPKVAAGDISSVPILSVPSLPVPTLPVPAPVPPLPNRSVSGPITTDRAPSFHLNLNQRQISRVADSQRSPPLGVPAIVQGNANCATTRVSSAADAPHLNGSSANAPSEIRRDPRWPNKYFTEPRNQNNNYKNEYKKITWSSNGHGNGHLLIYNQPHSKVGANRNDQVHTTYREHREAKARAEAAEQQRQFMVDLKQQQEAEKKRQSMSVQKQRGLEEMKEKSPEAPTSAPVINYHLDISYRNCDQVGAPTKITDFRIPKKPTTVPEHSKDMLKSSQGIKDKTRLLKGNDVAGTSDKKSQAKNWGSPDTHISNLESEPPLTCSLTEEVTHKDVNQDKRKHKSDKSEKTKSSDKTKKHRKHRSTSESGKHGKHRKKSGKKLDSQEKDTGKESCESEDKDINKKLTTKLKIVGLTGPSPQTKVVINPDSSQESEMKDGEEETIVNGNEVKDHKAIISRIKRRNTIAQIAIDDDKLLTQTNEKDTSTPDITTGEPLTQVLEVKDQPIKTPQRIRKRRNTIAPIAIDRLGDDPQNEVTDNCSVSTQNIITGTRRTQESEVNDQPSPAKPARILKRRNTMASVASEPLVDKSELFNKYSPLYEDMQKCESVASVKGIQLSRSVANLFEKTSDNCSVSTQNIIAGKRRKRGDDVSFNETLLSRNCFKMGPIAKPGPKSKVNSNENLSTEVTLAEDAAANDIIKSPGKRKRGRTITKRPTKKPSLDNEKDLPNNTSNVADDQKDKPATDDAPTTSQSAKVQPRKPRRPKRNELEQLNEDIAQMYCAEEVMRASGRRTCTQQPLHLLNNSDPDRIRNVARRGVPYSRGPRSALDGCNRASFSIKQCRIRLRRNFVQEKLDKIANEKSEANVDEEIKESSKNKRILNTNPEWHALSSVINQCVVCNKPIKKYDSVHHYIQYHGENFGARFAPGMLNELRMNRGNRPVYCLKQISSSSKIRYHYTCPFCKRTADLTTSDWYDHLAQHTGELRYQCSKCQKQFHRRYPGQQHLKSCFLDANLVHNESYTNRAPIIVYVCLLCEFVQKSRQNLVKHLKNQHGINEEETVDKVRSILETIKIYHLEDVVKAPSKNVDSAKENQGIKPLTIKLPVIKKKSKKKRRIMPKKRFRLMAKKAIRLIKAETSINESNENVQSNKSLTDSEDINNDTAVPMDVLQTHQVINEPLLEDTEDMPNDAYMGALNGREDGEELILPDPEPMMVIDECKLEDKEDSLQEPQQKTDDEIIFSGPHCEKQESSSPPKKIKIIDIIEINDNGESNLSENSSDCDDNNQNKKKNNVSCSSKSKEKEEWVDLEKHNKHSKSKSIFGRFNRFCTRLKKNGEGNVRAKSAKCIGDSFANKSNDLPLNDHGELMPKMTALDPPAMDTALDRETITTAPPPLLMAPPTRVENVGFRRGSYFCFFPKCTFLYSNEVEGLENHFALEHPSVRWSGKCLACGQYQDQAPASNSPHSKWTIAQELSHMVEKHMEKPSTSFAKENENGQSAAQPVESQTQLLQPQLMEPQSLKPQSLEPQSSAHQSLEPQALEPQQPAPQPPAAPKLRVRRFSGDRLVPLVEREANISKVNNNTMLKDLLNSSPRPPNQQTIDFHATGLGEFLTTKNLSQPDPVLVNNHASGLGLSINEVFSLAQNIPPPQPTGDFIVTQSCLGENLDERTPAQINIVIKPAVTSVSAPVSVPGLGPARVPSGVVADRFRCMAPKCGFCAHTVMCIREHMKFHSFSFSSNDYLKCAYCLHIGVNVNDYVHHGVTVHGLASVRELESEGADSIATTNGAAAAVPPTMETPTASLSVTDQIRELFNQRNRQSFSSTSTSSPTLSAVSSTSTGSINATVSAASTMITELLHPTGYGADKLYACPFKGCSGSLNAKSFVSHMRYHLAIAHNQDADVKCKYCNICMIPAELLNHLQRFHGRHTVFCAICLATTLNRRIMHTHVKSKHEASFLLANRQLHFLPLSCENVGDTIELAAIEHPFGKSQLENFYHRLNIEWQNRRQNTKITYRHSEVRLLPKMSVFPNYFKCGDCNNFESRERRALQMHLYTHKANEVSEAYQSGKASVPDTPTTNQQKPSSNFDSNPNPTPNVPPVDTVTQQKKQLNLFEEPPKPGEQLIVMPKLVFVPPEKLYHCGSSKCSQSMSTELALRHHLASDHSYKDVLSCIHCKYRICHRSTTDTLIEHLEMHKQYVYQCGGCPLYGSKRAPIDRHIRERHQNSDVDVIIYKRDKIGTAMSGAKWFKTPKPSVPDFICNLCQHVQQTEAQMMAHVWAVHKKQYQYFCKYCSDDFIDPVLLIRHLLMRHPDNPVEPVQVYHRLSVKNNSTLGFYCLKCKEVTNTRQKISSHCYTIHQSKHQFKCPHCDFDNSIERNIANHMFEKHPFSSGRAIIQYERVANYIPDEICWTHLARDFEYEPSTAAKQRLQQQKQPQPIIVDEVELISSDEETPIENTDHMKSIEFACSYCNETSNDVVQLRLDHWANTHAEQPFYFHVQPQLLCPECKSFQGNAKTLLQEHIVQVHGIRQIVACDVRRPEECAYCEYRYTSCNDLIQHISNMGHRANDLKNVTDDELVALRRFGTDGTTTTPNEYYQCVICKVIMPTCLAMGQHGRIQHSDTANFCFRRLTEEVIYHCFCCMYASTDEKQTLRHMLDHFPKYKQCQFCQGRAVPKPGLDGYIQHRAEHSYADLKKYLMEIHYQFQNGLIITKSSLVHTKFNDENLMKTLDMELMRTSGSPCQPLAKRRKTACTNDRLQGGSIIEINGPPLKILPGPQTTPRIGNRAFMTSFTGRDTTSAPSTSSAAAVPINLPPRIPKRRFTVVGNNLNLSLLSKDK